MTTNVTIPLSHILAEAKFHLNILEMSTAHNQGIEGLTRIFNGEEEPDEDVIAFYLDEIRIHATDYSPLLIISNLSSLKTLLNIISESV